jgi:aspartate racemase
MAVREKPLMAQAMLGIVGGIAPGSTIDYYRRLIERYRERRPDGSYPSIVINSIDLVPMLAMAASGDRDGLTNYMLAAIAALDRAGAAIAFMSSNTPHLVFDEVARRSPVPLVSIVEATGAEARARGFAKVGLIGTRFTMDGGFYASVCATYGVDVVVPGAEDRTYVHDRYVAELVGGVFRQETRDGIIAVMRRMQEHDGIDAVILGGTELPLLLRDAPPAGLPLLDTTHIHVEAVLDRLLAL